MPYLAELGITDLYASPRFKARKGSSHGYDVADPQRVSSELGTEREFDELTDRLKSYAMGLLLDIVPNHMAASHENPWWMDVLENGPSSPYADYFDIDWHPATTKAAFLQENRVLLPVLGELYGDVLAKGELTLRLDEGGFFVRYYDHRFPIDPRSYQPIIEQISEECAQVAHVDEAERAALLETTSKIRALPHFSSTRAEDRELRQAAIREIKKTIWRLCQTVPEIRKAAEDVVRRINGVQGLAASLFQLDRILDAQPYRLAHWKIGLEEINYRRFFDVNDLVGLRVEIPQVFQDRHRVILRLVQEGKVTGLRVDHVDGLRDPHGYLRDLQQAAAHGVEGDDRHVYVIVEKILGEKETLPEDWPVSGTTGYDFLNAVNALFVEPEGLASLEESYLRLTDSQTTYAESSYEGNKLVMRMLFAGEMQSLSHELGTLAAQDRAARDIPMSDLAQVLREVTACLPVYRTYVRGHSVSARDRVFLERALALARKRVPQRSLSDATFLFLRQVLFVEPPEYAPDLREAYLRFVMRWQQYTGPVMAKGLEDTASYRHNSLLSLNDVGSDPLRESLPLDTETFHRFNQERLLHWPGTLNATSTHDTKRGEDVRARINVLSELPEEWERAFRRWHRINLSGRLNPKRPVTAPFPGEESLIYQTMLGAWTASESEADAFRERLKEFVIKAAREAKLYTDWIDPNADYEGALEAFVDAIFRNGGFLRNFRPFQKKVAFYGHLNSLSQTLLKIASPGVPDFYQGDELWDYNLVDPDNRRPVDFRLRSQLLEELKERNHRDRPALLKELCANWTDGRIKLCLTWKALNFRRERADLFQKGSYVPLAAAGERGRNLCAFGRHWQGQWAVIAAPRFFTSLVKPGQRPLGGKVWGKTSIAGPDGAPAQWRNVLTGERHTVPSPQKGGAFLAGDLLRLMPVCLLVSEPD